MSLPFGNRKSALVFDTETTGLIDKQLIREQHQPRMIEFFGNVVNARGDITRELEFFADPGIPIPPIITKITGINFQTLKNAKPFSDHADELIELIESCDMVVAHNMSYDHMIIELELRRIEMQVEWPTMICTVESTEWFKGYRLNLQDLHEYLFGEVFENAHRARNDVNALTRCFIELRARGDI